MVPDEGWSKVSLASCTYHGNGVPRVCVQQRLGVGTRPHPSLVDKHDVPHRLMVWSDPIL
jgi:hypothetical protein